MKVTSKDCIQFITGNIVKGLSNPKDWIRTKKTIGDNSIVRTFKNKKYNIEIDVMEKNGIIRRDGFIVNNQFVAPNDPEVDWKHGKILFVLAMEKQDDFLTMFVVSEKFFNAHGHLNDSISTSPICDLLSENGFDCYENIEATIAFYNKVNLDALKDYLAKSKVFTTNKSFEEYMKNPDYDIISIQKEK